MYQSLIAAPPRQPLFLRLMEFVVAHVEQARAPEVLFTSDMYQKILTTLMPASCTKESTPAAGTPPHVRLAARGVHRRAADPQGLTGTPVLPGPRLRDAVHVAYVDYPW